MPHKIFKTCCNAGFTASCFLLFFISALPAFAAETKAGSYMLTQCAVVMAGETPRVFITGPDGYLSCLDAKTGKTVWASKNASFAVFTRGNRLLAVMSQQDKKHPCMLAALDSRTGKILAYITGPAVYPANCLGESIRSNYMLNAFSIEGHDYITSTYTWKPMPSGVDRGPDYVNPPGSFGSSSESWEVDLKYPGISKTSVDLSGAAINMLWRPGSGYKSETFTVEGITAQTDMVLNTGTAYSLILKRWKDGETLPDIIMAESPWNSAGAAVSADNRHALAVYQLKESANPILYRVSVYSIMTGEKICSFDSQSWPIKSIAEGKTFIAYFPDRVFAVDLGTGRELWSKQVMDLHYRGPYPP